MVLAVFHLVARKGMLTQQQGDTLTDKRQREIEQVADDDIYIIRWD
jgi:hypothetical protein